MQPGNATRSTPAEATADPPIVAHQLPLPVVGPVDVDAAAPLRLGSEITTVTRPDARGIDPSTGDWHVCGPDTCAWQGHGCIDDPAQLRLREIDHHLDRWRDREVRRHETTARVAEQLGDRSRAVWHQQRAGGVARPLAVRVAACGHEVAAVVYCRACGEVHHVPERCNARAVCRVCARRWATRAQRRVQHALDLHLASARYRWATSARGRGRAPWRQRPRLSMVTLTKRDSGDLDADRASLQQGWVRLRAWWHDRVGAPPFARVPECTRGEDGDDSGHVHMHVVTVLPWIEYKALQAAWIAAVDGDANGWGIHVTRLSGSKRAAHYVSKYATKGVDELPSQLAAKWIAATWAKRMITTSVGFWQGPEINLTPCCASTDPERALFGVLAAGRKAREITAAPPDTARDPPFA